MGERAKVILNEHFAKALLRKDTLDLDKFYTADLKLFVEVARKEIKSLDNKEIELQETIRLANNNILKDISMIKTIGMEKQEIIQRLIETSKILERSDKE